VIGRDPAAHEPERGGEAVEHVDLDRRLLVSQQSLGSIEAGRARADDRDAKGVFGRS
jgi:hypothetical protein